jgi:hypothetical protein
VLLSLFPYRDIRQSNQLILNQTKCAVSQIHFMLEQPSLTKCNRTHKKKLKIYPTELGDSSHTGQVK